MLIVGGSSDGHNVLNSAELYDPDTQVWTPTGPLNSPRITHTATLLTDGRVLIAGGSNNAELFDPVAGTWTFTGSLGISRGLHSATLIGTRNPLRDPFPFSPAFPERGPLSKFPIPGDSKFRAIAGTSRRFLTRSVTLNALLAGRLDDFENDAADRSESR